METKKAYEERLQAQLDEWSAKIDVLKAKARKSKSDSEVKYAEEVEKLEQKKKAAREKLADFRQAGESAWQDLKDGLDRAWDDLGEAVKSASGKFKE